MRVVLDLFQEPLKPHKTPMDIPHHNRSVVVVVLVLVVMLLLFVSAECGKAGGVDDASSVFIVVVELKLLLVDILGKGV